MKASFLVFLVSVLSQDDYYAKLGIEKNASSKEIRKAFKKLAITMHPGHG